MGDVFDVVRIRPAMRSRANLDWLGSAPRKSYSGLRIRWDYNHNLDLPRLDRPSGLRQAVGRAVPCAGMRETAAWTWPDIEVAVPRTSRREAPHSAVQPVGNGAKGIVVERRHLVRIDRAVRAEAVPALHDSGGTHRYRIEPRGAAVLIEQVEGGLDLPDAAQSITYQGRPHET